jgi:hypothetical protein
VNLILLANELQSGHDQQPMDRTDTALLRLLSSVGGRGSQRFFLHLSPTRHALKRNSCVRDEAKAGMGLRAKLAVLALFYAPTKRGATGDGTFPMIGAPQVGE